MADGHPLPGPRVNARTELGPRPMASAARRRHLGDWLLLILSAEKAVQHLFITWAFATDRFDLRAQVVPPYEILLVVGGIAAILFVVAAVGVWRQQRWAAHLLIGLALVDIFGEFIAQGTIMIHIVVSFIVAWAVLLLAWNARRRYGNPGPSSV